MKTSHALVVAPPDHARPTVTGRENWERWNRWFPALYQRGITGKVHLPKKIVRVVGCPDCRRSSTPCRSIERASTEESFKCDEHQTDLGGAPLVFIE